MHAITRSSNADRPLSGTAAGGLLDAYLAAIYTVPDRSPALQLAVGASCDDRPAPGCVHALITACNPRSRQLGAEANDQRMTHLQQELSNRQIPWSPAQSSALDQSWREPSCWLRNVPLSSIDALARQFKQNACVVVDATGSTRLRIYRDDWRAHAGDDDRLQWPPP